MNNSFKQQLLNLLLVIVISASWVSFAQAPIDNICSNVRFESLKKRITQLEYIFNTYSQLLSQFQQQFYDNQADIDTLRDQIQENQYKINQVIKCQKKILLRIDSLIASNSSS